MKNKLFFILIAIFTILNLVDMVTAFFILSGESNPVYMFMGKWAFILVKLSINILIIIIYNKNVYKSQFEYFLLLTITVLGIFLLGVGAYSNIMGMLNPSVIEYASNLSTSEKLQSYGIAVGLFGGLPFVFNLITFKLWEHSSKYIIIKRKK